MAFDRQTILNMSVVSTAIVSRCSILGVSDSALCPKTIRTIATLSSPKNQSPTCFVSAIPNSPTISSNGCNIQLSRNATHSASLVKEMQSAAKPLVICGPSGVGKSSIVQKVQNEFPDCFGLCVSHTTRNPREDEKDGVNYYFVKKRVFLDAKERGEFIETAEFAGKMYGTSRGAITQVQKAGLICILDVEIHGVQQIKNTPYLDPHYVFIAPPSIRELEIRLRKIKTETEDNIKKRLEIAAEEMEYGTKPQNFDRIIINDNLDNSAAKLRNFIIFHIIALKRARQLLAQRQLCISSS